MGSIEIVRSTYMKKLATIAITCFTLLLSGCGRNLSPQGNLSPQLAQDLDDIKGNQATLENNQNAIKIELGRLQNELSLSNSNNNELQQGWINVQSDGILIGIFGLLTIGMILFYMSKARKYKQMTDILGQQIKLYDDEEIKEKVMAASWNTHVEKDIYRLMK